MEWFIKCFKNYANFKGRARRKEYWYFALILGIINIVFYTLKVLPMFYHFSYNEAILLSLPFSIWSLVSFVPSLSVMSRRLHDTNRSAWVGFLPLIFSIIVIAFYVVVSMFNLESMLYIGFVLSFILFVWYIVVLVFLAQKGTVGENKYGPDPKELDVKELFK